MTPAERRAIELEISRLEDIQADSIVDKKTSHVLDNHRKIQKLRRLLEDSKC